MTEFKTSLSYFVRNLKQYWRGLLIALFFILIATYAQIKAPLYLGDAISALTHYLVASFTPGGHASLHDFYVAVGSMIAFYLLTEFALLISSLISAGVSSDSVGVMRRGLFAKLQRMPVRYFDTHQDGKILSLFTSDLDNIFTAMNNAVFQIFSQFLLFVGVLWMMFEKSATMAWVTMASTPIAIILALVIVRYAQTQINHQQAATADMNGYINEQLAGQTVLLTEGRQADSLAQFAPFNDRVKVASQNGQFYSGLLNPLMQGFSLLNLAIVIFFGSWLVLHNGMDKASGLALVVVFVNYSQQLFQPITSLTTIYNALQLAATGASRITTVEKEDDEVNNGKKIAGPLQQGVVLDHVDFSYNPDRQILKDVSIEVKKGQMVALVGPTGSGKTTVMNLLNRFYDLSAGEITYDGTKLQDFDLYSLRDRVGIVLQESVVFSKSILDNIRYGKPEATLAEVQEAAKQARIHDFIMSLPEQYDTQISPERDLFSSGQKQLLSIARTILTDPDLLILDEATSNVDTVTEAKIQEAMDNVMSGRTSFVIAHRLKTILSADQIVVLKDGQVLERGSHAELLKQKGFYAELYTNQMVFD
ncbi:multidrug ABC transporter ATPase/permease [Fructobacillus pseudoficulneus]|uniref:Multidrug ABC transporter ATPase/permease n=1 Tax=Fructobacillus pseudoficulneus TaxID=220714 RepID=A0A3F3H1K2_9LACO|nr:ABC transporter ATP-binding protein [Fructobacillus pseudoficulneus]GAP02488.1 multidrug ABC transporter ATPase/permease [Fructobacillus pseudoficulneus]SEH37220.1 ATP-binding cassette, subfamily B, multidrug efflux pump [Fructobacillus pseudoficulneus]